MRLWLVGGDDRQLHIIEENFVQGDDFKLVHWYARGEKGKTGRAIAPEGTTHIVLASAHCYNVMAQSARNEARRLKLPFASFHANTELVDTLARMGFPRRLRKPKKGELEAIVSAAMDVDVTLYGSLAERKAECARISEVTRAAGLASSLASVSASVWRIREKRRGRLLQAQRDRAAAKEQRARERTEAVTATKAKAGRPAAMESKNPASEAVGLLGRVQEIITSLHAHSDGVLQRRLDAATSERDGLRKELMACRKECEDMRSKLALISEATQL